MPRTPTKRTKRCTAKTAKGHQCRNRAKLDGRCTTHKATLAIPDPTEVMILQRAGVHLANGVAVWEVLESLGHEFPEADPATFPALCDTALKTLEDAGAQEGRTPYGWHLAAHRNLYARAVQMGDMPTALKVLKALGKLQALEERVPKGNTDFPEFDPMDRASVQSAMAWVVVQLNNGNIPRSKANALTIALSSMARGAVIAKEEQERQRQRVPEPGSTGNAEIMSMIDVALKDD